MKNKIKSIIYAMITGVGIGMPITIICMILIGGYQSVMKEFIVWLAASALYGLLSAVIFTSEKLNLILSTIFHCLGCFAVTIFAGRICGYSTNIAELIIAILPVFVIVYGVIYAVTIINMKIQAKKANEALGKR